MLTDAERAQIHADILTRVKASHGDAVKAVQAVLDAKPYWNGMANHAANIGEAIEIALDMWPDEDEPEDDE